MPITIILYITVFLVAICIGSFLNVLIYRLPNGLSIVSPPSHCPSCGKRIRWYDNIPIISYIVLRGKCRDCGTHIPARYLLIELINPILWAIVVIFFDLTVYSAIYMLTASVLLTIVVIDGEHQIIPDSLNVALAVFGLVLTIYGIFYPDIPGILGTFKVTWWEHLVGGVGGGAMFLAVFYIYKLIRKREGLGGGDIKFIAAAGLILGYKLTLLTIGLSALIACLYLLVLKIAGKLDTDKPIPYGPFLSVAAFLSMIFGNYLINLYLSLF